MHLIESSPSSFGAGQEDFYTKKQKIEPGEVSTTQSY